MELPNILSCSNKLIFHCDDSPQPIKVLKPHIGEIICCAWQKEGKFVASGGADKQIVVTSLARMDTFLTLTDSQSPAEINSLDFSKKAKYLASGSTDGLIKIWDLQTRERVVALDGLKTSVSSVAWDRSSSFLAGGSTIGKIAVYQMASKGRQKLDFEHKNYDSVVELQFSPLADHIFATCSGMGHLRLWDLSSPEKTPFQDYNTHTNRCTSLTFNPVNINTMCTVGLDRKLFLYDIRKPKAIKQVEIHTPPTSVSFCDDGATLCIGTSDGKLAKLNFSTLKQMDMIGHQSNQINQIRCIDQKTLRESSQPELPERLPSYNSAKKKPDCDSSTSKKLDFESAQQPPAPAPPLPPPSPSPSLRPLPPSSSSAPAQLPPLLLGALKEFIHQEVQALHLDMIRQFEVQKDYFENIVHEMGRSQEALQKKYDELLKENEKLKKTAF